MSLLPIAGGSLNVTGTGSAEDVTAITINIKTGKISEYTNFTFNSMFVLNGQYYGIDSSGLHELTGNDDNGTGISAAMLTGITDFPNSDQYASPSESFFDKTLTDIYTGMRVFDEVGNVRVRIEETNDRLYYYPGSSDSTLGLRNLRWPGAKGLRGRSFQVGYENASGSDFHILDMLAIGARLKRRI